MNFPSANVLGVVLDELGLRTLESALQGLTFSELAELPRLELLAHLKENGVDRLGDRQKLATAIAKTARASDGSSSGADAVTKPPRDDLVPQSFQIYCHNTTLADGTTLDNKEQAPEFVIAALEERTGVKRPANANCTLHELNLHFMTGS